MEIPYNDPDQEHYMIRIQTIETLGRLVRETRNSQGLTQSQLASVSGVGRRFISDLEAGKKSCHLDKTLSVIMMLGLDLQIQQRGE
jgi:y4mF family transcriptional regulator